MTQEPRWRGAESGNTFYQNHALCWKECRSPPPPPPCSLPPPPSVSLLPFPLVIVLLLLLLVPRQLLSLSFSSFSFFSSFLPWSWENWYKPIGKSEADFRLYGKCLFLVCPKQLSRCQVPSYLRVIFLSI